MSPVLIEGPFIWVHNQHTFQTVEHDGAFADGHVAQFGHRDQRRQLERLRHDGRMRGPAAGDRGKPYHAVARNVGGFGRRQVIRQNNDRLLQGFQGATLPPGQVSQHLPAYVFNIVGPFAQILVTQARHDLGKPLDPLIKRIRDINSLLPGVFDRGLYQEGVFQNLQVRIQDRPMALAQLGLHPLLGSPHAISGFGDGILKLLDFALQVLPRNRLSQRTKAPLPFHQKRSGDRHARSHGDAFQNLHNVLL